MHMENKWSQNVRTIAAICGAPDKPLVPTRKSDALLLAAQRWHQAMQE